MTFFFNDTGNMRRASVKITHPCVSAVTLDPDEETQSCAEENWENEGGHLSSPDVNWSPLNPFPKEITRLEDQVDLWARKLTSDFVNGRVGMRYNTYTHRARVLRLQRAELDAMRRRFNEPEQTH
ncbi:hypothetical protein [Novosphingobium rosa]|uniref:hypothetical protein n=1 Tax=Novosphingobium rosa TaxID=76978 RepID=UPI000AB89DB4|nr:hypothetical protein [Novosphingobium rosa]